MRPLQCHLLTNLAMIVRPGSFSANLKRGLCLDFVVHGMPSHCESLLLLRALCLTLPVVCRQPRWIFHHNAVFHGHLSPDVMIAETVAAKASHGCSATVGAVKVVVLLVVVRSASQGSHPASWKRPHARGIQLGALRRCVGVHGRASWDRNGAEIEWIVATIVFVDFRHIVETSWIASIVSEIIDASARVSILRTATASKE